MVAIDETGFPKKEMLSAGMARPYNSPLGRIANGQMGIFPACAGSRGHTRPGRELYLPKA